MRGINDARRIRAIEDIDAHFDCMYDVQWIPKARKNARFILWNFCLQETIQS